jgi:hypothetical protein
MRITSRISNERGVALVTALLAVLLATALMAGMFASLTADQRSHAIDRDQSQAYAAAHAGLEKLTSNLAQLFATDFSPSAAQIDVVDNVPPSIPGFSYTSPGGGAGSGYAVSFTPDVNGNPAATPNADITTGPFTGFKGLITPYTLTVTARSTAGSEVRLRREIQTVAVPVFQFGIFGEKSLSFHAGSDFDFGGRVHTNSNLFLAEGAGNTLTFRDRITAVGQVVRAELENGNTITSSGHTGTVSVPTVIGTSYRNLAANEGSVSGGPGSAAVGGWKSLSEDTYKTNIRNTMTGAKRLDLPLVSQGAVPIDLIRRPVVGSNENAVNAPVFLQRYFAQASLRILLSDRTADIMGLPTITATTPVALDNSLAGSATAMGYNRVQISSVSGASGAGVITFGTFPDWLKVGGLAAFPNMVFGGSTVSACDGIKNSTQLLSCTVAGASTPLNTNAAAAINLVGGGNMLPRTAGSGSVTTGGAKDVTLVSTRDLALGNRILWANNSAITCTGYKLSTKQLTGCSWNTAPAANNWLTTNSLQTAGQTLLGGFIKIEKQNAAGAWSDVTAELLALGFSGPTQEGTSAPCADPTPNAVIRLQRLRDNATPTVACGYGGTTLTTDFWPNVLFVAREATFRDMATYASMTMAGVMNYVTIDVANLKRWLSGAIGVTGSQALNNNGYIVYFSDRRGNHNDAGVGAPETGEYGNEDSVNSAAGAASSAPNALLEGGEDRNENGTLETYGALASTVAGVVPGGALAPYNAAATPLSTIPVTTGEPYITPAATRVNKQVLFRRALKLVNGGIVGGVNNLPDSGLTITTENGVYVQGNYNAISTSANTEPNRPAAIIADTITILSNAWTDVESLNSPNDQAARPATTTGYRFAMIAGKSIAFAKPNWAALGNWGTDGGVHNFMRMLEDWSGETTNYRGSMVSLYTARQFVGIFKNNSNVYTQGTRAFAFDTDFLTPSLLPPGTPMFRDINTLKFRQILRPNQ